MLHRRLLQALLLPTAMWAMLGVSPVCLAANYKVLHHFAGGNDGGGLFGPVTLDARGSVFGITWGSGPNGHGTVFKIARSQNGSWKKETIWAFCSLPDCSDGSAAYAGSLVIDMAGNIYGPSNISTFQLTPGPDGWTYQQICACGDELGYVMDSSGNLFGFSGPGDYHDGNIIELSGGPGNWTQQQLYSFCPPPRGCRDGEVPMAALTFDAKGNLYGTTEFGGNTQPWCFGSGGCGVAFRLENLGNGQWKYQVMHRFAAFQNDGQTPLGGLVVDKDGNAYGTTPQAGKGGGTIFKLSRKPDGHWKETILYNFPDPVQNGGYPASTLVFDKAGNLYGTATSGGDPDCDCGVIFKMTHQPSGDWTYGVLYKFIWATGAGPTGLTIDSKGNLYGATAAGGKYNAGVAFKFVP
jgi:hypothetical protein